MYPLTLPAIATSMALGFVVALISASPLNGFAVGVLPLLIGLTWRRDEVPVLPFLLGYQWVSVVIGHFYEQTFGVQLSTDYAPGDVTRTMVLSLTGLAVLAAGLRAGAGSGPAAVLNPDAPRSPKHQAALFWLVIALYLIDYVQALNPRLLIGANTMLESVIGFRRLFVLALWYEVVSGRAPIRYLAITFVWVMMPALGAYFATFKEPVFMLLLVIATFWRPWETEWRRTALPRLAALTPVLAFVLVLGTAWQYGVKKETRLAYETNAIGSQVTDRASFFLERTRNVLPELWASPRDGIESLVARLSYVVFFSRVLEHVPAVEPHADGELLWMALTNGFMPRVLFPDKPPLPSDSYYTNRFTGLNVAFRNTSISIGYMAEFYADWGLAGMFLSIFGYGLWIGLIHRGIRRLVRPQVLIGPAFITVLLVMVEFEHQFIKGFAALNLGFAITVTACLILRPWLYSVFPAASDAAFDEAGVEPTPPLLERTPLANR